MTTYQIRHAIPGLETTQDKASTPDNFYRAYGVALLSWQHVEHSLFRVYWAMFTAKVLKEAGAAYYTQDSFGAKLRLVEGLAKVTLSGEMLEAWVGLNKRIKAASVDRNVLAHLTAVADFQADGSLELVLAPAIFVPSKLVRTAKRYDANECHRLTVAFEQLSEDTDKLASMISENSKP